MWSIFFWLNTVLSADSILFKIFMFCDSLIELYCFLVLMHFIHLGLRKQFWSCDTQYVNDPQVDSALFKFPCILSDSRYLEHFPGSLIFFDLCTYLNNFIKVLKMFSNIDNHQMTKKFCNRLMTATWKFILNCFTLNISDDFLAASERWARNNATFHDYTRPKSAFWNCFKLLI